jgi:predicted transposase YbfD/YdcC
MPTQDVALTHYFADLTDPRIDRTKKHRLLDILALTLCATIAGADTWEEVERFGKAKHDWLKRFLELPNGIPSHDTLNRVFAALDPKQFAEAVARWMAAVCVAAGLKQVAIDDKAARRATRHTFSGCLHLVSAWATENRLILGQEAVADGSNEIATIPQLLRVLELKGALVTIDAAGTQVAIATQIREQGGDYLLAVKGNQPALQVAVQAVFERACAVNFEGVPHDMHATADSGHERQEERYVTVIYEPEGLPAEWPEVAAVVQVGRERKVNGQNVSTAHYYLTSRRAKARRLGEAIRGHWGIENGLHWGLDVAFGEDENATRAGHAGANLGLVRRLALSLLKQDPAKGSIKAKRLSAALDDNYLLRILQGIQEN